jgi:hypothetical protein
VKNQAEKHARPDNSRAVVVKKCKAIVNFGEAETAQWHQD